MPQWAQRTSGMLEREARAGPRLCAPRRDSRRRARSPARKVSSATQSTTAMNTRISSRIAGSAVAALGDLGSQPLDVRVVGLHLLQLGEGLFGLRGLLLVEGQDQD